MEIDALIGFKILIFVHQQSDSYRLETSTEVLFEPYGSHER